MKVSTNIPAVVPPGQRAVPRRSSDPLPAAAAAASGDSVVVSPVARLLSQLRSIPAADDVDQARVSRIREQLAQGTYEIDNQALAQAFISKELQWNR